MLDREEQLTLLERIVAIVRKNEILSPHTKLSIITGIGSKVWKHTNNDEHIDQEIQW